MTTTTDNQNVSEQQQIDLLGEHSLKQMGKWYDQQIQLAGKSMKLSELKANIAKNRLNETYALVELARLTAAPPEGPEEGNADPVKATGQEETTDR